MPVRMITCLLAPPPPTPEMSAMFVTRPSIAPKTAARNQPPETSVWWWSCACSANSAELGSCVIRPA
jgi:hypothetical protein